MPSGIPDFRSADGIYSQAYKSILNPEIIISHSFFMRHPEEFYEFYKDKMIYENAEPNDAHYALAELEKRGKLNAVITQNIDGLHQKAGSKRVLELHGTIHYNYCMKCGRPLTHPVSRLYGLGPECGQHFHINPFETEQELREAVEEVDKKLSEITWSGWIAKSAVESAVEAKNGV